MRIKGTAGLVVGTSVENHEHCMSEVAVPTSVNAKNESNIIRSGSLIGTRGPIHIATEITFLGDGILLYNRKAICGPTRIHTRMSG